jgi:hypothetical protein
MEDILNYDKRNQLYQFLIEDFNFVKDEEKFDPKAFGNFYVQLSHRNFWLTYINDRSFLTISITSHWDPNNSYDLSFISDYIYDPENINNKQAVDNYQRIETLNNFIRKDFDLIVDLFDKANYEDTKNKIDDLLKRQFCKHFQK